MYNLHKMKGINFKFESFDFFPESLVFSKYFQVFCSIIESFVIFSSLFCVTKISLYIIEWRGARESQALRRCVALYEAFALRAPYKNSNLRISYLIPYFSQNFYWFYLITHTFTIKFIPLRTHISYHKTGF